MEFFETVNRRKTVREWADKQVTDEQINAMIDAGLKAPTHDHLRNWEFVVIHTDEEKAKALEYVKEWAARHSPSEVQTSTSPMRKMYNYAVPRQYRMLQEAPYIIIPFFKAGSGMFQPTSVSSLNPLASIWCAVENMLLAATAQGLACAIRIPVGEEGSYVVHALGAPKGDVMPCYIGVGYAAEGAEIPEQHEFTAEQRTHFGRW